MNFDKLTNTFLLFLNFK